MFLFATTFLAFLASATTATNYCDIRLCAPGFQNIGCNNTGIMQCTGTVISFNDSYTQRILDVHNEYRQKVASGIVVGFPPAQRMTTMASIMNQ